jgi:hypothetical protein
MKQAKIKFIGYMVLCLFTVTAVRSQDNNASISEELKAIWNNDSDGSSGIYSNGLSTENLPPVGGNNDGSVGADAPIDGGLGFLLAAGIGYAANGMRKRRKKENQEGAEEKENKI